MIFSTTLVAIIQTNVNKTLKLQPNVMNELDNFVNNGSCPTNPFTAATFFGFSRSDKTFLHILAQTKIFILIHCNVSLRRRLVASIQCTF